jgi:hypothetical protein
MGRKTISAKQRSIPVSFSVKPQLADRIEDMAYDQRFTRSKFLQEAVLRYINFIEMGGLESSENVTDMTLGRRLLIGANALQEANRENEPMPDNIMSFLKQQLEIYDVKTVVRRVDAREAKKELPQKNPIRGEDLTSTHEVVFERITAGDYAGSIDGEQVATIIKYNSKWRANYGFGDVWYDTLKEAKQDLQEFFVHRGA